ncbi:hypothetical protein LEP1GSC036_1327 [Leptospira weilii str. 2006001853]|uniref:Uncharacterized protein n=1 Tax=Leptospira weilii str. 2006001853 TaxID=1001589 RepID=A0A828Z4Z8_9LEPT|nr:hypothetical protein LEP1GSC036_1327 [Leptospira weilii str. 2006001853]
MNFRCDLICETPVFLEICGTVWIYFFDVLKRALRDLL